MTNDTTLILNPAKAPRPRFIKATAVSHDGMRFYCDDPLLSKWRAEAWIDGVFAVGFGRDPASARADLINQRNRVVMA